MSQKMAKLGFSKTENEIRVDQLKLAGKFPSWLSGTLIRNGPGTFLVGDQRYRHWFDGLPMLHKFTFDNGQISYANKFLNTQSYASAMAEGQIVYSEFATDPQRSVWEKVKNVFSPMITDSAKVNVAKMGEKYMALAETPIQITFDPHTLESTGSFTYEDGLVGQMTTVHPHFDYANNLAYNLVTRFHARSHYQIFALKDGKHPKKIASVPVQKPAYMHSFGMSQNYFILTEFPLVVNSIDLLLWLKPYIENYRWEPRRGTRFTIINRHTGEIEGRYECEPFFAFHHINAFEQDDSIILDIAAYEDASIIQSYYLSAIEQASLKLPFGTIRRYRVPINGKQVKSETLSDVCVELPNFDAPRFNTSENYQYIYAVGLNPQDRYGFYNQIVKVDVIGKNNASWYEAGSFPGEAVFVGRPGRKQEDDGVVLSVVLNEKTGNSFLLVLDAQSFSEIARAEVPHPILIGYHGAYFENLLTK